MEWMFLPYKRYFDFSGRSRRREYWMFFLFVFIFEIVAFAIIFSQIPLTEEAIIVSQTNGLGALSYWGIALLGIFGLATIIPAVAVQVRRFHDQDKSGWFVLLNLVPYVGPLIVFVFMCLEGTGGPNRFGADPKDPNSATVFA